ncbi:hypothetical protein PHMEG_00039404, partial [Phytophthora megakarya]
RPQYGPCDACGGQNHSAHYCFRRCRLCQQVYDFNKCEAFDEHAKLLRTNVDKKNISPELQKLVFAEPIIDAECIYAFVGKCEWPNEDKNYCMNMTGVLKERDTSLNGSELCVEQEKKKLGTANDAWAGSIAEVSGFTTGQPKMVKLLPGERMGW